MGLSAANREALLHNALLCLYGWETLILPTTAEDSNFHAQVTALHLNVCRTLDNLLSWHPHTIFITCQNSVSFPPRLASRNVESLRLTMPDHLTSRKIWDDALPAPKRDNNCDIQAYAENFHPPRGKSTKPSAKPRTNPNLNPSSTLSSSSAPSKRKCAIASANMQPSSKNIIAGKISS